MLIHWACFTRDGSLPSRLGVFRAVTTFAVINLLVGFIVKSMQDALHEDEHA